MLNASGDLARGRTHGDEHRRHEPGAFCWVGLATSDPVGAKAFYCTLFGWKGEELPAGDFGTYTSMRRDGKEVAILYRQSPEARAARAAPHWTPFVSVEDADASALRARELGGNVLREPLDFLDAGRVAAVRDPTGGILSLWQPRAHGGAELMNDPGALCWYELVTADVDHAKSFYGELLGWEYQTNPSGDTTITRAGASVGSMRDRGKQADGITAGCWIPYFGVKDAQIIRQKAEHSGGRTVTAPIGGPIGHTALLADPQGAAFALLELTDRPSESLRPGRADEAPYRQGMDAHVSDTQPMERPAPAGFDGARRAPARHQEHLY